MENQKIKELFLQAENDLEKSAQELNRPSSDVVEYAACVFGRTAIHRFMECLYLYYTEKNGNLHLENPTISEMLDYCQTYNPKLADVNFFALHCMSRDVLNTEEVFFCNDVNQVKSCSDIARDVRTIFVNDVWGGKVPI